MATSMGDYPQPSVLGDRTLVCQWAGCGAKKFATYNSLFTHLKRQHKVPPSDLKGSWVEERAMRERRAQALSSSELEHVQVVYNELGEAVEDSFKCVKCDKVLKKANCEKHMRAVHRENTDMAELSKWATVKDGRLFKNRRAHPDRAQPGRLHLTWAMAHHQAGDGEVHEDKPDDEMEEEEEEGCQQEVGEQAMEMDHPIQEAEPAEGPRGEPVHVAPDAFVWVDPKPKVALHKIDHIY